MVIFSDIDDVMMFIDQVLMMLTNGYIELMFGNIIN